MHARLLGKKCLTEVKIFFFIPRDKKFIFVLTVSPIVRYSISNKSAIEKKKSSTTALACLLQNYTIKKNVKGAAGGV